MNDGTILTILTILTIHEILTRYHTNAFHSGITQWNQTNAFHIGTRNEGDAKLAQKTMACKRGKYPKELGIILSFWDFGTFVHTIKS